MRVASITGPRQGGVVQVADPVAKAPWARVKVTVAPLCTEWKNWAEGKPSDCIGHEAVGIVDEAPVGSGAIRGQRVIVMPQNGCGVCPLCEAGDHIHCESPLDPMALTGGSTGRATVAEALIQQGHLLLPIPGDIPDDHAAMALCALGPTFRAMEAMAVTGLDTVLVSGAGAVGLGAVVNAVARGARVLVIENHPYRAQLALRLGAGKVFDPMSPDLVEQVKAATGGRGPDKSVETSSAPPALGTLATLTRKRGQMATIGWAGSVEAGVLTGRGLTVHGCWHWNHRTHAPAMFTLIRKSAPLLDLLVTHRFDMADIQRAWEVQATGSCGKVLCYPNGKGT